MKNRILTFITGVLVGAILTTTGFLIYSKNINNYFNEKILFKNNTQIQPPNGSMREPPAKPEEE